jgi:adenosine deaminase
MTPTGELSRDRLLRLPKTELHVHLDGSLRPSTLIELSREIGRPLPFDDETSVADYMCVSEARDLVDYLARFDTTLAVMQTAPAIERIAWELATDCAAENVRYVEVRFSPLLNARGNLTMHGAVDAALAGLRRAEQDHGIRSSIIICALRHLDPSTSLELARVAVDFKGRGVVAFDLAGPERGYPPAVHREAFRFAARANLAVTIHAGEAYGPESIREALHDCSARRIGHGTRLFEDPELLAYITDFRVPIEICLTSNVQTRVSPTFAEHPLRRFHEAGVVTTINTDNRLMSGTTVTDEYVRAHRHLGLGWEQLRDMAIQGFESAFLPWHEKQALVEAVRQEIATLEADTHA